MKIAFTVCTNNYLPLAKTLADSLVRHNPEYKFFIGLCDKKSTQIDYSYFEPYTIVLVEDLKIRQLESMVLKYDIVELSTSVRPFYFQYFFSNYSDVEHVFYFDPDMFIYNSFNVIESEIEGFDVLLTPHILSHIPMDDKLPVWNNFLRYGLYNAGFIALKKSENSNNILQWLANILSEFCFSRVNGGLFVDQLPFNYIPIFFKNIAISRNPGLNMAWWNLHERTFISTGEEDSYIINNHSPLIFFHFSNFNPLEPQIITSYQNRVDIRSNLFLNNLFSNYSRALLINNYEPFIKLECFYVEKRLKYLNEIHDYNMRNEPFRRKFLRFIKRHVPQKLDNYIKHYSDL